MVETLLGDRYRLEAVIARGGMGQIWRAHDTHAGQPVAIKRLPLGSDDAREIRLRDRLLREARTLERVRHPHVVRYIDSGIDDEEQPFLVMEWLDAESLRQRQHRAPLNLDAIRAFAEQTLDGLQAIHEAGLVHRDLKPENLLLVGEGDGFRVKVVDFGLALMLEPGTRLTHPGQVMGTLRYISPEQTRNAGEVDLRADLYSLGVVLYELSTGVSPFPGDHPAAVLLRIVTETPAPPRQLRPELPGWLDRLITQAMRRVPAERFASAASMRAAIHPDAALDTDTISVVAHLGPLPGERSDLPTADTVMEHRLVSMLCTLVPPDRAELVQHVERAIAQHGGDLHTLISGEVVGLWGLRQTMGDEALRAVRAGLLVQAEVGAAARIMAVTIHFEVAHGQMVHGRDLDQPLAQLAQLPAGELILDGPTQQVLSGRVDVSTVGGHRVVRRLVDQPSSRRVLGVEVPMVGREPELAALRATFDRAADAGEPEAAIVVGPAGMGKSRLFDEILRPLRAPTGALHSALQSGTLIPRARCVTCIEAHADASKTRAPYHMLADAIARQADIRVGQTADIQRAALRRMIARAGLSPPFGEDVEQATLFLGAMLGIEPTDSPALRVARADPKVMREQIVQSLTHLLRSAGSSGPVALCLEDLHWADAESLQLCEQLLDRLAGTPFFLLATTRPELLEQRPRLFENVGCVRVELRPLPRRPMGQLIEALVGRPAAPEAGELIVRWSSGNPYFAQELVAWIVTRGVLVQDATGWHLDGDPGSLQVPASIEGAIQGRMDRLSQELKGLLKAAAVFGTAFWDGGCEALGFTEVATKLHDLEHADFVVGRVQSRIAGASEWEFRHALLHQVAYRMLSREQRANLHLQAARWLERVGELDAALLAHHFDAGGDVWRAAEYYARAGRRALADGDLEHSVRYFEHSLVEGDDAPDKAIGLARARSLLGDYTGAWDALEQLAPEGREACPAELHLMRGRILYARGQYPEAEQELDSATAALTGTRTDEAFEIEHTRFGTIWAQGRYVDAGQVAQRLFHQARGSGRRDQLCSANLALAYFQIVAGDLSRSLELLREAVEYAREAGHPYREVDALMLLGSTLELVGLNTEASAALEAASEIACRLKTAYHQATIAGCRGQVCASQGEPGLAVEHYQRSVDLARQLGDNRATGNALAGLASALCQRGQPDDLPRATEAAARALELSAGRAPPVEAEARLALARIALSRNDPHQAAEHAAAAVTLLDELGAQEQHDIEILLVAHDALLATGSAPRARQALERAWRQIEERASRIGDERIRRGYYQRADNLQVRRLWEACCGY